MESTATKDIKQKSSYVHTESQDSTICDDGGDYFRPLSNVIYGVFFSKETTV